MIVPPPALRISGTAYLHIKNAPVRLTASASFQSSSVKRLDSAVGRDIGRDIDQRGELAERMDCAFHRLLARRRATDTSACTAIARPPELAISPATCLAASGRRSAMATNAPAAASRMAMAPPISPPPPVIKATRPLRRSLRSMSARHFIQFPQPVEHLRRRGIDPPDHAGDLFAALRRRRRRARADGFRPGMPDRRRFRPALCAWRRAVPAGRQAASRKAAERKRREGGFDQCPVVVVADKVRRIRHAGEFGTASPARNRGGA